MQVYRRCAWYGSHFFHCPAFSAPLPAWWAPSSTPSVTDFRPSPACFVPVVLLMVSPTPRPAAPTTPDKSKTLACLVACYAETLSSPPAAFVTPPARLPICPASQSTEAVSLFSMRLTVEVTPFAAPSAPELLLSRGISLISGLLTLGVEAIAVG